MLQGGEEFCNAPAPLPKAGLCGFQALAAVPTQPECRWGPPMGLEVSHRARIGQRGPVLPGEGGPSSSPVAGSCFSKPAPCPADLPRLLAELFVSPCG